MTEFIVLVIVLILLQCIHYYLQNEKIKKNPRKFLGYTSIEIKKENILGHTGNAAGWENAGWEKLPAINLTEGVKKVEEYAKHCGYDQSESTKISEHFRNCFEEVKAAYEKEKSKREERPSNQTTRKIIEKSNILCIDCREQLLKFMHYIFIQKKYSFTDIINLRPEDIDNLLKIIRNN